MSDSLCRSDFFSQNFFQKSSRNFSGGIIFIGQFVNMRIVRYLLPQAFVKFGEIVFFKQITVVLVFDRHQRPQVFQIRVVINQKIKGQRI